jgi:hypothetical protein
MPAILTDALIEALDRAAADAPELPVESVERMRGAVASCAEAKDTAA